ncbi:MAG: amylo-alpha-1,6-glucosidase [Acidobacteria bacterium]|nr:MAG: amylo-alpha-1,6-glucosidase [Acidobacteriota bacterium]
MPEILQLEDEFSIAADAQRTISPSRVLKHGDMFAVFDQHGDIIAAEGGEHGLYYHGTRFLSTFEVLLAGRRPLLLSSTVSNDNLVFVADLTNVDVRRDNRLVLPHGEVHLFRSRILGDGFSIDMIRVCNHSTQPIEMPLVIRFDADFVDVFEVRGTRRQRRGTRQPDRSGDEYVLAYLGLDNVERRTRIRWSQRPDAIDAGRATFRFTLDPHATLGFELSVTCEDEEISAVSPDFEKTLDDARRRFSERTERTCTARSSNESLNRWLKRSSADLEMMITDTPHGMYPYAGIPWFSTPFGRDGLITAFELLWVDPAIARGVLSFLAATQATVRSDAQDAEPGKILHEMRQGEMPALGEVPFGRYYGSIDSTPLFIALAAAYYRRTGDRGFIDRLWPNLLAALTWMERDGDCDRDGFLEYARHSANGLVQQGWKDSNDSVFHADGRLASAPIALCEVQGYAYAAWRGAAQLAEVRNDLVASDWHARADRLRECFDDAFWCEDLGTYALALDGDKRPCHVRSSNPAHCLFTGIVVSQERARRMAATLMDDTSFAGWGLRTVSAGEPRYNPMSYHNGSIWPHDNAIAAAGLARYGFTAAATRILDAMLDLSQAMELHRLPELLCGFHRRSDERPTQYPVACAPQAWAAGAVYMLLQAAIGMDIDAVRRRITFCRASLPASIDRLVLTNLTVGDARVDLALERHANDVGVNVVRREGQLEIVAIK